MEQKSEMELVGLMPKASSSTQPNFEAISDNDVENNSNTNNNNMEQCVVPESILESNYTDIGLKSSTVELVQEEAKSQEHSSGNGQLDTAVFTSMSKTQKDCDMFLFLESPNDVTETQSTFVDNNTHSDVSGENNSNKRSSVNSCNNLTPNVEQQNGLYGSISNRDLAGITGHLCGGIERNDSYNIKTSYPSVGSFADCITTYTDEPYINSSTIDLFCDPKDSQSKQPVTVDSNQQSMDVGMFQSPSSPAAQSKHGKKRKVRGNFVEPFSFNDMLCRESVNNVRCLGDPGYSQLNDSKKDGVLHVEMELHKYIQAGLLNNKRANEFDEDMYIIPANSKVDSLNVKSPEGQIHNDRPRAAVGQQTEQRKLLNLAGNTAYRCNIVKNLEQPAAKIQHLEEYLPKNLYPAPVCEIQNMYVPECRSDFTTNGDDSHDRTCREKLDRFEVSWTADNHDGGLEHLEKRSLIHGKSEARAGGTAKIDKGKEMQAVLQCLPSRSDIPEALDLTAVQVQPIGPQCSGDARVVAPGPQTPANHIISHIRPVPPHLVNQLHWIQTSPLEYPHKQTLTLQPMVVPPTLSWLTADHGSSALLTLPPEQVQLNSIPETQVLNENGERENVVGSHKLKCSRNKSDVFPSVIYRPLFTPQDTTASFKDSSCTSSVTWSANTKRNVVVMAEIDALSSQNVEDDKRKAALSTEATGDSKRDLVVIEIGENSGTPQNTRESHGERAAGQEVFEVTKVIKDDDELSANQATGTETEDREHHNRKERIRRSRARIRDATQLMRQLVPGLSEKTDKATVVEFAARYMYFLMGFVGRQHDKEFLLKYNPY